MKELVHPYFAERRAVGFVGTGGVGSGRFFALAGNHTLGREESREGSFLQRKDYCKLHIIAHCFHKVAPHVPNVLIGAVGDDETGAFLRRHMAAHGLNTARIAVKENLTTLDCVVLLYPDGSNGNLTENNSASHHVGKEDIVAAESDFRAMAGCGLALAAPEIPLDSRLAFLELATTHGLFRAASFTAGEIPIVKEANTLANVDLLALNSDEIGALIGQPWSADHGPALVGAWLNENPGLGEDAVLIITDGARGSWVFHHGEMFYQAALPIEAVSGAGAGDAFLGAFLGALSQSCSLQSAQALATVAGAVAATSEDTIHPDFGPKLLQQVAREHKIPLPDILSTSLPDGRNPTQQITQRSKS